MRKAVLVLLVLPLAACGGGSKSSAPPSNMTPVAYVKSAATKTAQAPSEHVTVKGSVTVATTVVPIDATGDFDNATKSGSMHVAFSAGGLSGTTDEVLHGTTVYLQSPLLNLPKGKTWLKIDLLKVVQTKGIDFSAFAGQSPMKLVSQLQAAGNVTKVGEETINGAPTTHYRARIDASKLPQGDKLAGLAQVKYGPVDIWIGSDDGYVHRMRIQYSLKFAKASAESILTSMDFSDFGKSVSVSVPPASATVDGTGKAITGLGG
jgi:hypothetical protein